MGTGGTREGCFEEKRLKKVCKFKFKVYLCNPVRRERHTTSSLKRLKLEVQASTEKKRIESVNSFEGISCQDLYREIRIYKEEFDPGSG